MRELRELETRIVGRLLSGPPVEGRLIVGAWALVIADERWALVKLSLAGVFGPSMGVLIRRWSAFLARLEDLSLSVRDEGFEGLKRWIAREEGEDEALVESLPPVLAVAAFIEAGRFDNHGGAPPPRPYLLAARRLDSWRRWSELADRAREV